MYNALNIKKKVRITKASLREQLDLHQVLCWIYLIPDHERENWNQDTYRKR